MSEETTPVDPPKDPEILSHNEPIPIKKKKLTASFLEQMATLTDKAEVLAAGKLLTLMINNYCMDQKEQNFMEISKKYNDLYVELNTALTP